LKEGMEEYRWIHGRESGRKTGIEMN